MPMTLCRLGMLAAASVLGTTALHAQPAAQPLPAPTGAAAPAPAATFAIKGFRVSGDNPLSETATQAALAPFVRPDATIETLQQATAALEAALRAQGFGLHRVALPPQEVSDAVTLNVVRFSIGKIAVEGNEYFNEGNIRRSLPELQEGGTPNFKQLAVQAAIANDNPAKQIQVSLRESKEADKIDANILVKETKPWNFATSLSNAGSAASGRDRLTFSGGHSNLFDRDQQFVGAYTTSIERPNQVQQVGLSYRVPVYPLNGVLGVSYTHSDVVGNFGAFSSSGAGQTLGVTYTYHMPPDGGYRGFFVLGIDDKVYEAVAINGVTLTGQMDRRSRPIHAGYNARNETDGTFWTYNLDFAMNTGGGAYNTTTAYATEDPRITNAYWKAWRGGANYLSTFADGWLWNVRGEFQLADDALISGEQFGLGGANSVRGTGERLISGDRGLQATLEVSTPPIIQALRFIGFIDAGWLNNINPNGTTKPRADRIASWGFGARFVSGKLSLSADYGRLFKGSKVPLTANSLAPQRGDDKLHVNMIYQF